MPVFLPAQAAPAGSDVSASALTGAPTAPVNGIGAAAREEFAGGQRPFSAAAIRAVARSRISGLVAKFSLA